MQSEQLKSAKFLEMTEEDRKFEELATPRNTADGLAHAAAKTLEDAGDKATDEEKAAIEAAIADVQEAVKGDDKEAIDQAAQKLSEATSGLAQKMYAEQAEAAQAAGADAGAEQAGPGGDDVVDAEFEEVKDDK